MEPSVHFRKANKEPSMHFSKANTKPSMHFSKANTKPSMHFRRVHTELLSRKMLVKNLQYSVSPLRHLQTSSANFCQDAFG